MTKRFGALTVLPVRMNPDLGMSDELLKKTGAANLFMVFGEPDVVIKETGGQLTVELRGLDVYDPTTGAIRSHATDDLACLSTRTTTARAFSCGRRISPGRTSPMTS